MSTPSRPRATKIICTIGPATDTSDMLGQLIEAGANVFRLNMSHSKHDWVREVVFRIRRKAAELQANIAILFDLQGPSIRTGDLPEPYHLKKGDTLEIRLSTAKPELPFSTTVNYDGLLQDVQVGHTMVVDNGGILMRIEEVRPDRLICKVLTEGVFGSRRHINLPGVALRLPALTEKDLAGTSEVRIHKEPGITNSALLSALAGQTEIISFTEEIPSMNDIFINTVSGTNTTQA